MKTETGEHTLRVSEIFYSIEGEGPLAGAPTVFVRFFGCNFTCKGFSNPDAIPIVLTGTDDLSKFKPTMGCDSIYAWHPSYKSVTKVYTINELADAILAVLPPSLRVYEGKPHMPILSLTGGEPTMHQAGIAELLNHAKMEGFSKILIETNAALHLKPSFMQSLAAWSELDSSNMIIWSCSPKLSNSGEPKAKAIKPEIIALQRSLSSMQYLKFVSDGSEESFNEIESVFNEYSEHLKSTGSSSLDPFSVYVMPVGATLEQQMDIQRKVADMCLLKGYNFCARVHCYVYGNEVGT